MIRYPSVGAWALHTLGRCAANRHARRRTRVAAGVAAAAAIRARLSAEIEVPASGGIVALPSLGAASYPATGPP